MSLNYYLRTYKRHWVASEPCIIDRTPTVRRKRCFPLAAYLCNDSMITQTTRQIDSVNSKEKLPVLWPSLAQATCVDVRGFRGFFAVRWTVELVKVSMHVEWI